MCRKDCLQLPDELVTHGEVTPDDDVTLALSVPDTHHYKSLVPALNLCRLSFTSKSTFPTLMQVITFVIFVSHNDVSDVDGRSDGLG